MLIELIKKEFKDLVRDPRIWLPFIISALILPFMGLILSLGVRESVAGITSPSNILISDLDNTELTDYVVRGLKALGLASSVEVVKVPEIASLTELALSKNYEVIVVFSEGFTANIKGGVRPNITAVDVVKSISFVPSLKSTLIAAAINELLSDYLLRSYGVNLSSQFIKSPASVTTLTYLVTRNQTLPGTSAIFAQLSITSFMLPIAFMIITLGVLQMAATSTAVENEEKTLEVLLTLPISRFKILLGKLLGSFSVALLGSALNIAGFLLYFYIFSVGFSTSLGSGTEFIAPTLILITPESVLYLAVSLVLASFAMATLGVTIGVLSSDVRIATTVSGPASMFVIIPSYYVMFTDISKLSPTVKSLLYAVPFTQPMVMSKELMLSQPDKLMPVWLASSLAFSITLIVLTSKVLTFEKLIKVQRLVSRFRRSK
ncbi:MAG: ABC transporter permease [Sulfolobales archaeon]|nr:ABC transporter permease [Sulfolobales archaeon]MDW7970168.1 ABC transporter permease [Sulfolobales archaeon]